MFGNLTAIREMSENWPEVGEVLWQKNWWKKFCHGKLFIAGITFGAMPVFSNTIRACSLYCWICDVGYHNFGRSAAGNQKCRCISQCLSGVIILVVIWLGSKGIWIVADIICFPEMREDRIDNEYACCIISGPFCTLYCIVPFTEKIKCLF